MSSEPVVSSEDVAPTDQVHPGVPVVVDRYTGAARINHWITALCLVLLALSGLALFHPDLFFLSTLLFFSFAGLFFRFWHLNLWKGADTTWLARLNKVLGNRDHTDPELVEIGKYNAGQKIVFWGMTLLILVLIVSGFGIWDQYFAAYTSIETKRIAVLVHSMAAVIIICVWIVHVYAAIWVRGTIPAMTRGIVTGGWAWRHHRKWLRELAGKR